MCPPACMCIYACKRARARVHMRVCVCVGVCVMAVRGKECVFLPHVCVCKRKQAGITNVARVWGLESLMQEQDPNCFASAVACFPTSVMFNQSMPKGYR